MIKHEMYQEYVRLATAAGAKVCPIGSFRTKHSLAEATAAIKPKARSLASIRLSGQCGYIHDKLEPNHRARARRWWRNLGVVDHELRERWMSAKVPVELCEALGVACHPAPRR